MAYMEDVDEMEQFYTSTIIECLNEVAEMKNRNSFLYGLFYTYLCSLNPECLPKRFRYSRFRYSVNKKPRRRPFFRYYSEFRYLGFRYSSRYLYFPFRGNFKIVTKFQAKFTNTFNFIQKTLKTHFVDSISLYEN